VDHRARAGADRLHLEHRHVEPVALVVRLGRERQLALDEQAALTATVIGRITPEGKQKVIEALRDAGRFVAMVGDGVNDVPALKASRLAIAHLLHDHYQAEYEALFGAIDPRFDAADPGAADFPPTGKPGVAAYDAMPAADKEIVTRMFVRYGKENVLVVLTADHGVTPFPERSRALGHPGAVRVVPDSIKFRAMATWNLVFRLTGNCAADQAPASS